MTTLSQLRSLIDRELGTSGWEYRPYDYYPYAPEKLRTQRGDIPFSTMKLLVELIPALLEEQHKLTDAEWERAWEEGYSQGRAEGYDEGLVDAQLEEEDDD